MMAVAVPFSTTISSSQNPLIRHAIRLRDNRYRLRQRAVIVDGAREIQRAMAAGFRLRSLFVAPSKDLPSKDLPSKDLLGDDCVERLVAQSGDSAVWVTPELLSQIAYGGNPREAVAVFDRPEGHSLDRLVLKENPLVIVMVGIEKPGNAGAIFRSADAVGADAVVLCGGGCDLFNPNLIRGSLGTVFTMPCVESDEAQTVAWVRRGGLSCMAAIVGATQTFWDADYLGPTAIVVGSEAQGLGPLWRNWDTASDASAENGGRLTAVSIPMLGVADSLNVSVSAAALLFEARRQRTLRGN